MNAKTAKKLRRIALGMAVAAEQKNGKPVEKVSYKLNQRTGNISVDASSYKGAYKALKNGVNSGIIDNIKLKA